MREADIGPDVPRLAVGIVVVEHDQHGHVIGGGAAGLAPVEPFPGHVIAVAPDAALVAAGELLMAVKQVGHAVVAPLAEERGVGPARKGPAAFPQRLGVEVAVGVEQPESLAQEVEGVLQFAPRGVVVVVALGVHDAEVGIEPAPAGLVVAGQPVPGTAEAVVQLVAQIVVHQPHARGPVAAVAGGLAEVLAEQQRVVAVALHVEGGVAVVAPVAEAVGHVELPLGIAAVACGAGVVVVGPEEVVRHVLDRVQPQAVELGGLDQPTHAPAQVGAHVLREEIRILREDVRRQAVVGAKADVEVLVRIAAPVPGIPLRGRDVGVGHAVVELRMVRMAHEAGLGTPGALREAVVLVRSLVGDVNQVRQAQMDHLPGVAPVPAVVPLAVETVLGAAQVEILRHHAGIHIYGRDFVVGRNVERPVVHDVVHVDADAKPVRGLNQVQQFRLGAVPGRDEPPLAAAAQIERIEKIIAHGKAAATLGRWRQPEGGIAGLGQLGHLVGDLLPTGVEVLEHGLPRRR